MRQETAAFEASAVRNFSIGASAGYDHCGILKSAFWEVAGLNTPSGEENPTKFPTWERKTRWQKENERMGKKETGRVLGGKPYWSGGLMNQQMPLTHPLIFCDHWQSGTTLGKGAAREWVKGRKKKRKFRSLMDFKYPPAENRRGEGVGDNGIDWLSVEWRR